MTVLTSTNIAGPYSGDGSNTTFDFSFKVFSSADLQVVVTDEDDVETTLTLNTDYSVSIAADYLSGTITYPLSGSPLPATSTLSIIRVVDYTQGAAFQNQGGFYPKTHENAYDKSTMQIQQLKEQLDRAPKFTRASGVSNVSFPYASPGYFLAFNSTGDGFQAIAPSAAMTNTAVIEEYFSYADMAFSGGHTSVTTDTAITPGIGHVLVFVSGVPQRYGTDFDHGPTNDTNTIRILNKNLGSNDYIFIRVGILSSSSAENAANISYTSAAAGATGTNVKAALDNALPNVVSDFKADPTGVNDSYSAFAAAIANKKSFYIPPGLYYLSQKISTSASEADAIIIQGSGMSRTVLMFRGTDGVELLGTGNVLRDLTIVDGDSFSALPTTTAYAVDQSPLRANITAGTVGLRLDRNYIRCDNVMVRGFEIGIQNTNTKFYMSLNSCRAVFNEYGHVNGSGLATDAPNFNFSNDCGYTNNFGKNVWIRSGFHIYNRTTFESCTDYDLENDNFPNGGIHIEFGGHGVFNSPYIENCMVYNASPKTIFNDVGNVWNIICFAPTRINGSVFAAQSENLILPPWERTWKPSIAGALSITNTNTFLSEDKRYSRITTTGGAGVSKVLLSHWSPACRGIRVRDAAGLEYRIKYGYWFRFVSGTFTTGAIQGLVQFIDTAGNDFALTNRGNVNIEHTEYATKLNATGASGTATSTTAYKLIDSGAAFTTTVAPGMYVTNTTDDTRCRIIAIDSATQLTLEDDIFVSGEGYSIGGWQYRGGIISIKGGESTGVALAGVRLNIQCEQAATDCSSVNRVFDIAEPEIRFLYAAGEGGQMYRAENRLYEITELTIASGAITVVDDIHTVDTEADGATDDLDTINCDYLYPGKEITLMAANDARSVVLKDGTGNLKLAGDCTLDNSEDTIKLVYNGTNWLELMRSNNGA